MAIQTDYGHELEFGVGLTPATRNLEAIMELGQLADVLGLDLVSFQDHPCQSRFLDGWKPLSFIAARTSSIRLAPDVIDLPLTPPVVLARCCHPGHSQRRTGRARTRRRLFLGCDRIDRGSEAFRRTGR